MKKFLMLLSILCCGSYADTINLHWLNEDGTTYQNSTCTVDSDLELPTPPTKYGYTFTGWKMVNYTPIEYLESTGTQWIDTGVIANENTGFYLDLNIIYSTGNRYNAIFGVSSHTNDDNPFAINTYEPGCVLYFKNGQGNPLNIQSGMRAQVSYIDNILTKADGTEQSLSKPYNISNETMFLFTYNNSGMATLARNMKVYNLKIYYGVSLIRDFIPVLDMNGVPCLFDRVEAKFYYNQGTGQFIAGPVLTE